MDDARVVVAAPLVARKFIGQPLDALAAWARKYGGFSMAAVLSPGSLFDAVASGDPAGKDRA